MLRAAVVAAGVLLLFGAIALAGAGCPLAAALRLALPGVLLIAAVLGERWRYKRLREGRPGRKWVATDERFVDPESGRPVTVYYQRETGQRRYLKS